MKMMRKKKNQKNEIDHKIPSELVKVNKKILLIDYILIELWQTISFELSFSSAVSHFLYRFLCKGVAVLPPVNVSNDKMYVI